jgi:hypothetical protein
MWVQSIALSKSYKDSHINILLTLLTVPLWYACEGVLAAFPYPLRQKIANTPLLFKGMIIIAKK